MYRIPSDLDLSEIVGESTTQICVGQFDLQFTFGPVSFAIMSQVNLKREGELIGIWEEKKWPDAAFYEVMNVNVSKYEIPNDRQIIIYLENGIEIHLSDDSDQYECMLIQIEGDPTLWVI